MLPSFAVALAEKLLNPLLRLDAAALPALQKLQGKQLAFALRGLPLRLVVTAQADGLWLNQHQEPVDCSIDVGWDALQQLQDPSQLTRLIREGKLNIEGDINTLQRFSHFFQQFEPDWDEWLSRWLGDALAHKAGLLIRSSLVALKDHVRQSELAVQVLLQDELRLSPVSAELARFSDEVSQLAARTEQLQYQLRQLNSGVVQ